MKKLGAVFAFTILVFLASLASFVSSFSGESDAYTVEGSLEIASAKGVSSEGLVVESVLTTQPTGVYATTDGETIICLGPNPVCTNDLTKPTQNPALEVKPLSYEFEMLSGATDQRVYTLTNTGNQKLTSFSCASAGNEDWVSVSVCPEELDVGASANVAFTFTSGDKPPGEYSVLHDFTAREGAFAQSVSKVTIISGRIGPTPLPQLPPGVSFATAICPPTLVLSPNARVLVKLYYDGVPSCDDNLRVFVQYEGSSPVTYDSPACLTRGLNQFIVDASKDGKYTVAIDENSLKPQTSIETSSCEFRALHAPAIQASELDILAMLFTLFTVFMFLGKKK